MRYLAMVLSVLLLLGLTVTAHSQIPNAGFEDWVGGEPSGWITPNLPGADTLVASTLDRHSGSLALRGEVGSLFTFPVSPTIFTGQDTTNGFPVNERHASLTGWYKFAPVSTDKMFVTVVMYTATGDTGVGVGGGLLDAASDFTLFTLPITYATTSVPGQCFIEFSVIGTDTLTSLPNPGSAYIIDDLAFSGVSAVGEGSHAVPAEFSLMQNYPNPFNGETRIAYRVPGTGDGQVVTLKVYDMLGREVATLVNERQPPGEYGVTFDAGRFASGVYLYRLRMGAAVQTRRMMLLR